jgi:hypothetical protein
MPGDSDAATSGFRASRSTRDRVRRPADEAQLSAGQTELGKEKVRVFFALSHVFEKRKRFFFENENGAKKKFFLSLSFLKGSQDQKSPKIYVTPFVAAAAK